MVLKYSYVCPVGKPWMARHWIEQVIARKGGKQGLQESKPATPVMHMANFLNMYLLDYLRSQLNHITLQWQSGPGPSGFYEETNGKPRYPMDRDLGNSQVCIWKEYRTNVDRWNPGTLLQKAGILHQSEIIWIWQYKIAFKTVPYLCSFRGTFPLDKLNQMACL